MITIKHPSIGIKKISLRLSLCLCLLTCSVSSAGANDNREKGFSDAITLGAISGNVSGEVITLSAEGSTFLGLINEDTPREPKGTIILLHSFGLHPDSPRVIQPLRKNLSRVGWVTLSIQLPVLNKTASKADYLALVTKAAPRIAAALNYLEGKHPKPFVIVGHGLGGLMASHFLAKQTNTVCNAFVAISLPSIGGELSSAKTTPLMSTIKLPILDIYGSQDLAIVKGSASDRKSAFLKNNPANRQVKITGANHFYDGLNDTLSRTIQGWLTKNLAELASPAI